MGCSAGGPEKARPLALAGVNGGVGTCRRAPALGRPLPGPLGSSGSLPCPPAWLEAELAAASGGALYSQTLGRGGERAGGFLPASGTGWCSWHARRGGGRKPGQLSGARAAPAGSLRGRLCVREPGSPPELGVSVCAPVSVCGPAERLVWTCACVCVDLYLNLCVFDCMLLSVVVNSYV